MKNDEQQVNEVDKKLHELYKKKEKEFQEIPPHEAKKQILRDNLLVDVSKRQNPITHTTKIVHSSSKVYINLQEKLKIPPGYVAFSSVNCEESHDYYGAARYGTFSALMKRRYQDESKVEDAIDKKDEGLKEFLGFDDDEWQKLLQLNDESKNYYNNPKADGLTKQILFFDTNKQDYINFAVAPSSLFVHEYYQRIKSRTSDDESKSKEYFVGTIKKKVGGAQPNNVSFLFSRLKNGIAVLDGEPFYFHKHRYLERFTRRKSFFLGFWLKHNAYILMNSFDRLYNVVHSGYSNANIESAIDNIFMSFIEAIILPRAYALQNCDPGWSNNKLVKLPTEEKVWLDPECPEHKEKDIDRQNLRIKMFKTFNRLYTRFRKENNMKGVVNLEGEYQSRFIKIARSYI